MLIAWLAIVGLPPLSGFFSKDEIITSAFLDHDYGLWIIGSSPRCSPAST